MIIDCFMFFNELDLLELRLNELNDVVDRFVICESYTTHSGLKKPLYFIENKERFNKFKDKIFYILVNLSSHNSWKNEYDQRNMLSKGFENLKDDDIIILSDLDEIPNSQNIKLINVEHNKIYNLKQTIYYYYLNVKCTNMSWAGTQMFTYKTFKDSGNCLTDIRRPNNFGFESKLCKVPKIDVENNGWHFSYLGGVEKVKEKMKSFMHQEMVQNINLNTIENSLNVLNWIYKEHNVQLQKVEIDNTYPKYLLDNIEKYKHLIKE